jgi:hypothetical protein
VAGGNPHRCVAALGALFLVVSVVVTGTTAVAQVPPLPPETQGPLEILSPVVQPACGNALLAATVVAGTVPPETQEALGLLTANLFVVCGSVPRPVTAPTRCADADVVETVLALLSGSPIGGAPVAPPGAGQVVDAITILQDRFPIPADDEGLVATAAAALACQAGATRPAPTAAVPSDDYGTFSPPATVPVPVGSASGPVGFDAPTLGSVAPAPVLAAPVMASSSAPASEPRRVSYPLFLIPLVVLVAAVVVGRGLIAGAGSEV